MLKGVKRIYILAMVFILIFNLVPYTSLADNLDTYDLVIKGGTIYSPSTDHELKGYNIGINGSKIMRITRDDIKGEEEIDARGLAVSPGFIDLISYDPNSVGIKLKVLDGVTSNLAMHGGTEDAESWYRAWGNTGVLTNYGASSFITRQRWPIVGQSVDAEMTKDEDIKELVDAVRKNVEAGALGISFSLEYVPGIKDELLPLFELAKEYNLPTFHHLRYSDKERGLEGIEEVLDLGRQTGAIVHIMHINSTGGTFVMEEALKMVNEAKDEGLDISTCFYPYDYWATYLGSARFRPGWQERFNITYEDLQIGGTDIRITKDTFDKYRRQNVLVAAHGSLPESELIMLLKDHDTMIGSDTIIEPHFNNHPRGAGTYSRLFGKYVREEQILSIMDGVKKASYLPAKRMESSAPAMKRKGRIEVGADADITIFNSDTIIDKSTVKDTAAPSEGVEYVIINGVVTKDRDGIVKGVSPGQPIKSYFVDQSPDNEPLEYKLMLHEGKEANMEKVYKLNDRVYLSLFETLTLLDIPVKDLGDGLVEVGSEIKLEIGSSRAYLKGNPIQLAGEPIIYKEDTYILMDDFKSLLDDYYEIEHVDNLLKLKPIEPLDDIKEVCAEQDQSPEADIEVKDEKVQGNRFILIIQRLAASVLVLIVIMAFVKREA